MEEWRDVVGYEGLYQVSNLGNVKSLARFKVRGGGGTARVAERILKPIATAEGRYVSVNLAKDGTRTLTSIHRIVARAFLGESPLDVNHKNGVRNDNRETNLEYTTTAQNIQHAIDTSLRNERGARNPKAKLTDEHVAVARLRIANGDRIRVIATDLGVQPSCIYKIKNGRSWASA